MPASTGINSTRLYGRFQFFRRDVCREIGCSKMLAFCCIQSFERSVCSMCDICTKCVCCIENTSNTCPVRIGDKFLFVENSRQRINLTKVTIKFCMSVGVWAKSIHHRTIPCFEYIDAIMTMTMQHQDQHDDESIQDRRRDASG